MGLFKTLRTGVAGALVMAMPLQAVGAAVRPSAAIPTAATAVAAQDEGCSGVATQDEGCSGGGIAWPAIGVFLAAIILAILIERHNNNGRGPGFSR